MIFQEKRKKDSKVRLAKRKGRIMEMHATTQ